MHDPEEEEPVARPMCNSAETETFDTHVRQALSSTEWISDWAADAAAADGAAVDERLSVAWIRVVRPSGRLLDSLQRLGRVQGRPGRWNLMLDAPTFTHPAVLHRWSTTAMSVLASLLGRDASFVAFLLLGESPRTGTTGDDG